MAIMYFRYIRLYCRLSCVAAICCSSLLAGFSALYCNSIGAEFYLRCNGKSHQAREFTNKMKRTMAMRSYRTHVMGLKVRFVWMK